MPRKQEVDLLTQAQKLKFKQSLTSHTDEALDTILDVMRNCRSGRERLAAATFIIDKVYGSDFKCFEDGEDKDSMIKIQIVKHKGTEQADTADEEEDDWDWD